MALIKTPDGGFYVNDDEFEVNYSTNSISLTGQGGGGVAGVSSFNGRTGAVVPQDGDYTAEQVGAVPLSGGTMDANAVINGTDSLEISIGDASQSAVVGVTQNGVTIEHNTNSDADSSIRAIDNAIEIKANNTTVTVNGTGVALGGAAISGVNSLAGQNSNEIAIESNVDMNSHNLTNIGTGGIDIITDGTNTNIIQANNNIALSLKNNMKMAIGISSELASLRYTNNEITATVDSIVMGRNYNPVSKTFETGGIVVDEAGNINVMNVDSATINFTSPQPINFNNNRLTGIANPTNGSDAVNLTYFQSNVPPAVGKATTSIPGVVKAINGRADLSEHATLAEVIAAFNQLLGDLADAGIMISPS